MRRNDGVRTAAMLLVAGTWLVHGLYNKLLGGAPRHLAIVQSVPGLSGAAGEYVLAGVGGLEVAIAVWVLSGLSPRLCAATQTVVLLSMNLVELTFARDLLLWPAGLIPVNVAFLGAAWMAASANVPSLRTRLRRHPIPIEAHFSHCLTLTYALPAVTLRPLLPPGLELDTFGDLGFVAVALVQADSLRPAGVPGAFGQRFFLAGYRLFARFRTPDGRVLRGLYILRSDTDKARMIAGGNLLTHYNYHRCDAIVEAAGRRLRVAVRTHDGESDLDLVAHLCGAGLPPGSPFTSLRDARRFAGPMPFTFDYEAATHAIVAVKASRTNWRPVPVRVDVRRLSFLDRLPIAGGRAVLAAAFHVENVNYRWERGVCSPLAA